MERILLAQLKSQADALQALSLNCQILNRREESLAMSMANGDKQNP